MKHPTTKEARRAPRSKHDSVLEIYDANGHFIEGVGRLVNFSNVGICFSSTKDLAKGARLRTKIRLLREGMMEIAAHIVRVEKKLHTNLYGVEFDDVQKFNSNGV